MVLKTINKITGLETDFEVQDLEDSTLFYHFQTDFKGLDDGEYRVETYDNLGKLVATSLMTIGTYNTDSKNYITEDGYIQYNP